MTNMPQNNPISDLLAEHPIHKVGLIQRWYALTSLPDAFIDSSFVQREAVRKSRLSSSVIFFFMALVLSLVPVTYLVIGIYPSYFWLSSGLFIVCAFALMLNRRGLTNTAGFLVTFGSFLSLSAALFSTVPFDETTLQGYDMFILLLLLSVSLLPIRTIFLFFVLSVGTILSSLFLMPLTSVLAADLHSRMLIIIARPLGILVVGGGVAYILATHLTTAIQRANRAETVAKLEHELVEERQSLQWEIDRLLQTHVEVANGNFGARVPLSEDNKLWQIGRALNTLLIRYQRAALSEQQLKHIDRVVSDYVAIIQRAKRERHNPTLPLTKTNLDPLIAELQGTLVQMSRPTVMNDYPPSSSPNYVESNQNPPRW